MNVKTLGILTILIAITHNLWGDQIFITGTKKEGAFQSFERNKISFHPKGARTAINPMITQITRLLLDKPLKVAVAHSGAADGETMILLKYENRVFHFTHAGKELTIPYAQVKTIHPELEFEGFDGALAAQKPIPEIDVTALAERELTAEQQATLKRYTEARGNYDAFVAESTALAAEAEKLLGPKREALLTKLRQRKFDETAVRNELNRAATALQQTLGK